jgi:SufE protein probably involved in Fe-S center assembly
MTIKEIQNQIVEEFSLFTDWMEKYEYLIELGKDLAIFPEEKKQDENLIKGCQSRVWLCSEYKDGLLFFMADSDAIITKGIASLLVKVFSGQRPGDIVAADLDFLDQIGLKENLSPTRANGLLSMVKQIKYQAVAYAQA